MGFALILPTVVIIAISLVMVRIGAVILMMTGLDPKRAMFEALSAFTGTGFTTRRSEVVIEHDVRRRVVMTLIVLGNVGFIGILATLMNSFINVKNAVDVSSNLLVLIAGILIITYIARRRGLMSRFEHWVEKRIARASDLKMRQVAEILTLTNDYGVGEIRVTEQCPLVGKTLADSGMSAKSLLVLAIQRDFEVIPSPGGASRILNNDKLICYGRMDSMKDMAQCSIPSQG